MKKYLSEQKIIYVKKNKLHDEVLYISVLYVQVLFSLMR